MKFPEIFRVKSATESADKTGLPPRVRPDCALESVKNSHEAIRHVNAISRAEELFAKFFDADFRSFHLTDDKLKGFLHGFVQQARDPDNRLGVHFDHQATHELVVIEFDLMFFDFADFNFELHTL